MTDKKPIRRRNFLGATAKGLSFATFGGVTSRVMGANDTIILGIIGAGGRGRSLMKSCLRQGGGKVYFGGVCDVYEPNLNEAAEIAGWRTIAYSKHEELLERKDIDAIVIASPEHWHYKHLLDSIAAEKDVYLEKPMSWSIEQGVKMVKSVRNSKQVVQVGMQRRSTESFIEAKKIIDRGTLGEVSLVRTRWCSRVVPLPKHRELVGRLDWERFCGPAKKRPVDPIRYFHWRYFWDYSGGSLADQGAHLMDVVQWFTDVDRPVSAVCQGDVYHMKGCETPDTFSVVYEYPNFLATWTLTYASSYRKGWETVFQGSKASLEINDSGVRVFPEPWKGGKPAEEYPGGVSTDDHVKNWLDCLRTRQDPNANVEVGHGAASACHLANLAYRKKKRAILNETGTRVRYS